MDSKQLSIRSSITVFSFFVPPSVLHWMSLVVIENALRGLYAYRLGQLEMIRHHPDRRHHRVDALITYPRRTLKQGGAIEFEVSLYRAPIRSWLGDQSIGDVQGCLFSTCPLPGCIFLCLGISPLLLRVSKLGPAGLGVEVLVPTSKLAHFRARTAT